MEKLVVKAREQSGEIERLRAQLDLKDRRSREKEDELQEKDDDNAELTQIARHGWPNARINVLRLAVILYTGPTLAL